MDEMVLRSRKTPIEVALDIDDTGHTTARKLYAWLELNPAVYARWVKSNILDNAFAEEGKEYSTLVLKTSEAGGRPTSDYLLSASFAKKLAMSSRSPKGEETRNYFIKVEEVLAKVSQKPMTPAEMFLQNAQILLEQERRLAAVEDKQEELGKRQDILEAKLTPTIGMEYFSITGYISLMKYRVSPSDYSRLGKMASALSREKGYRIGSAPHPTYGHVGTYHTDILREVFDRYEGKW